MLSSRGSWGRAGFLKAPGPGSHLYIDIGAKDPCFLMPGRLRRQVIGHMLLPGMANHDTTQRAGNDAKTV
jgi:hypothetical protein